ncbi:MAG: EFR1 family ferrodoxin [Spirochaetes bacterium]|nr:EFR1 family ferrodoxin [Spirochaetota bacterium]
MDSVLYYFSGTGNTYRVACDLAKELNAKLLPIASQLNVDIVAIQDKKIGLIFPVYYMQLPPIVSEFVCKLTNLNGKYVFALATYGGGPGNSYKKLNQLLKQKNSTLSACFGVHMPQNAFYKPWENHQKIYHNWQNQVSKISRIIKAEKKGNHNNNFLNFLISPFNQLFEKWSIQYLSKLTGLSEDKGINALIKAADCGFSVNEQCTNCGVCAEVCPVNNIIINSKIPTWHHHCQNCLACYNYCPQQAIECEFIKKGYYYHHPDVNIKAIKTQKVSQQPAL